MVSISQNLQLLVNGIDRMAWATQDGWSIAQNWSRQGDTASFTLIDEHVPTMLTFAVPPMATVALLDVGTGQTLFSGICPKPQVKFEGPALAHWQLDCVDYTYLADRTLVVGDISGLTADQLAILITTQAACGITATSSASGGSVYPGPQIARIQFNYCTLTQAWTKISKLASTTSTYGWSVDENLALRFHTLADAQSSGWTATDDITTIDDVTITGYLTDTFAYEWDATSLRNVVTVRGANYSQTQTDSFAGDGVTDTFPLTFVPDASNIATATLTVNGVAKTVSAATGSTATTDWIIVGNLANQWFLQPATSAEIPAASDPVIFTYPFLQPVVSVSTDMTSVAQFSSLPNHGQFAYYIADSTLTSLFAAQQRALRETATYGLPTERAQIDLPQSFTGHLRAGQTIRIINSQVPDAQNTYIPGIDDRFLIVQLRINGEIGLYRTYQITAARVGT